MLLNQLLFNRRPAHMHTHTPTHSYPHTHSHICLASISRGNNKNNGSSNGRQQLKHICSISVWVLQNFRITKLPQFCRTPLSTSPAGISCCRCSFRSGSASWWSYTKKKEKKNKRRTEATATATAVSGTQAVSGLVVVVGVGGVTFRPAADSAMPLLLFHSHSNVLPLPPLPCSSHKACQSIFVCVFRFCARVRESEKRIRQCLTIALQLDDIY